MPGLGDFDVVVVGGGYAGLSAAMWAARYRRSVLLVDGGHQRNEATDVAHGYLGFDGATPGAILRRARTDLRRYESVEVVDDTEVRRVRSLPDGTFELELGDDTARAARRLILATGVRDVLPAIEHFEEFYGTSVFTCPSCDGYEVRGRAVAVIGDDEHIAPFALSLLDWASRVTMIVEPAGPGERRGAQLAEYGIDVVVGTPQSLHGTSGHLRSIELADGTSVECDAIFCTVEHRQRSALAEQLGCEITGDGCVRVDEQCRTSVPHVFAAGDMTPGPHLIQVAAAEGAVAGIAAATSLRGDETSPQSPQAAPDPDEALRGP